MTQEATTTALVPYRVQPPAVLLPTRDEMAMIKAIAATAGEAGSLLPQIGNRAMKAEEAAVIMLYGRELGVQPMASLSQIYVVKGRPQPSAQLYLGLMQARDPDAFCEILERTEKRVRIALHYRGRRQVFEATMEDAELAGLTRGREGQPTVNWKLYPKQMLTWTAVRTGARLMAPDALSALAGLPNQSTMEDFVAVDDDNAPPAEPEEKVVEGATIARPDQPPASVENEAVPEVSSESEGDETATPAGSGESEPPAPASDEDSRLDAEIVAEVNSLYKAARLDKQPGLARLVKAIAPDTLKEGVFYTSLLDRAQALRLEAALVARANPNARRPEVTSL